MDPLSLSGQSMLQGKLAVQCSQGERGIRNSKNDKNSSKPITMYI